MTKTKTLRRPINQEIDKIYNEDKETNIHETEVTIEAGPKAAKLQVWKTCRQQEERTIHATN